MSRPSQTEAWHGRDVKVRPR